MRSSNFLLLPLLAIKCTVSFAQCVALPNAYAHNDYWHKRPLYDALSNGFTYFEADVFLKKSKLVVAHIKPLLRRRTLEKLYLEPIANYLQQRQGKVQNMLDTLVLMIDIKSDGEKTFTALESILQKYKHLLSSCENGQNVKRNLTIVITGHKPLHVLRSRPCRFFYVDEDLQQVNQDLPFSDMYATASCKYSKVVNWNGEGQMPDADKNRLCQLIAKAHLLGKKVRLWGMPEKEMVWQSLLNCGVDLINTDKLVALRKFFAANTTTIAINE